MSWVTLVNKVMELIIGACERGALLASSESAIDHFKLKLSSKWEIQEGGASRIGLVWLLCRSHLKVLKEKSPRSTAQLRKYKLLYTQHWSPNRTRSNNRHPLGHRFFNWSGDSLPHVSPGKWKAMRIGIFQIITHTEYSTDEPRPWVLAEDRDKGEMVRLFLGKEAEPDEEKRDWACLVCFGNR